MPPNKYLPTTENGSKLAITRTMLIAMTATKKTSEIEISASLIPTCLQVGVALGIEPGHLQEWADKIDLDSLETGRIDYMHAMALIDLIRQRSGRSDVVFLLGEAFGFHFSPAVSTYLSSLDSLRTLLADLDLVKDFFSRHFDIDVQEIHDVVRLRLVLEDREDFSREDPAASVAATGILVFCQKLISSLLAGDKVIEAFHFRQPPPDNLEDYCRYFRAPLNFNSSFDGLVLPVRWLDQPLRGALPSLNSKARQHMQSMASPLHAPTSLAEKILSAFTAHHDLLHQPIGATAYHFNISERTLQRKLRAEDITFFELQEQAKKDVAGLLLKAGHSAESVADRLGFSDRRSFCRAFKRWFGMTPSIYRARMLQ